MASPWIIFFTLALILKNLEQCTFSATYGKKFKIPSHVALWPFFGNFVQKLQRVYTCIKLTFSLASDLTGLPKSHKQPKKANKGHEGHSKGQKAKSWKVDDFFMFLGPFGVNLLLFLVFPSFKAVKAKKAARVARTTIFCNGMSNDPKLPS